MCCLFPCLDCVKSPHSAGGSVLNFTTSQACVKTFNTHGCSRMQQSRCPTAVTRHCIVPPPTGDDAPVVLYGYVFISPVTVCGSMTHFCPHYAVAAGPGASLLGHFTYLYPFLCLLTGWFGMVRLQRPRLVPRRSVRGVSTCSGASHLRAGRLTRTRVGR